MVKAIMKFLTTFPPMQAPSLPVQGEPGETAERNMKNPRTRRTHTSFILIYILVLIGGDSQDARAIHGSSISAMVHPSAFVLNGLRLVVVATPG